PTRSMLQQAHISTLLSTRKKATAKVDREEKMRPGVMDVRAHHVLQDVSCKKPVAAILWPVDEVEGEEKSAASAAPSRGHAQMAGVGKASAGGRDGEDVRATQTAGRASRAEEADRREEFEADAPGCTDWQRSSGARHGRREEEAGGGLATVLAARRGGSRWHRSDTGKGRQRPAGLGMGPAAGLRVERPR
ncbi:hypothetical protein ABZP36_010371, partial [Zizania latifolia]